MNAEREGGQPDMPQGFRANKLDKYTNRYNNFELDILDLEEDDSGKKLNLVVMFRNASMHLLNTSA